VRFTGSDASEPDLGGLTSALSADGGRVSFVHGGIDRIQGHAQGRLVVSAEVRADADSTVHKQVAALLERARQYANHVEVLGYV
jgi:D-methionine transport system ATP-binding protein